MSIPDHHAAGDITVGNEQQSFGQLIFLGGHYADFDSLTFFTRQTDSITVGQAKSRHIAGSHLQGSDFVLIFLLKLALADATALICCSTGNKYKSFSHITCFNKVGLSTARREKTFTAPCSSVTEFPDLRQQRIDGFIAVVSEMDLQFASLQCAFAFCFSLNRGLQKRFERDDSLKMRQQ